MIKNSFKEGRSFRLFQSGFILIFLLFLSFAPENACSVPKTTNLRAPAYPLITVDPYLSAWSACDHLYDNAVTHWTGKRFGLIGAIRVDGQVYRFLGKEEVPQGVILPTSDFGAWEGKYVTDQPSGGWEKPSFDDGNWKTGKGAFGTKEKPAVFTLWETNDIWVRREFKLDASLSDQTLYLIYSHDDVFELYLNGKKVVETGMKWSSNVMLPLTGELRSLLIPGGKNVIAAHCHNTSGGGYVDFGICQDKDRKDIFTRTAIQKSASLSATRTFYEFTCGPVNLKLTFVSPLLTDRLDILSRPVNYIDYEVSSSDGVPHAVQIYFEATPEWAVYRIHQEVTVEKGEAAGLTYLKTGTVEQPVLKRKGDDVRIDWGYFYLCGETSQSKSYAIGGYEEEKSVFSDKGMLKQSGSGKLNARMYQSIPVMAYVQEMGKVTSKPSSGNVMVAYDDLYSIQYFGDNLMAWWKEGGKVTIIDALKTAASEREKIIGLCDNFDTRLWNETLKAGGQNYAELCVLAYRQSIAAHKLVKDRQGNLLFFSKENFSNGCIATVDVTYPSAPLFLHYNPDLLKGMMNPIFYYSESGKRDKPFAAHDLGTFPLANGQVYGTEMPVEECGNMLILTAAIAQREGNAEYARLHWNTLSTWADYLVENGLDPENQLCTDDFAGHFAHNANLSVKAILGIAAYGEMAQMLGKPDVARKYSEKAKEMAAKWVKMADDGDHYRLTFDQPGTWSQKYNLVWDKILGLNIFPKSVAQKEIAYYLTKQNKYGLPLDNRKTYTKSDWIVWTATLADNPENFRKIIDPLHLCVNETPVRVPMTDWYETLDARKVGFQARSVVGGYFIKLLEHR